MPGSISALAIVPPPEPTASCGQMSDFLTLVGLAALVIAGIGIAGGVSSYLDQRRTSIATLKVLGATSSDIVRIYAMQIGVAAMAGSMAGLAAGVLVTPLLAAALEGLLPVESGFIISPSALLLAASYGLLVAFAFAAAPLLRARTFPAMALMRSGVVPLSRDRRALIATGVGLAAICALALLTTDQPMLSGGVPDRRGGCAAVAGGSRLGDPAPRPPPAASGQSAAAQRARQSPPARRAHRCAGNGAGLRACCLRVACCRAERN